MAYEKKDIKVLIVLNLRESEKNSRIVKTLEEFVPKPEACNLVTETICIDTHAGDFNLQYKINSLLPDIIIHYGLGNGCFWNLDTLEQEDLKASDIKIIQNNFTANELLFTDKLLYTSLFDEFKEVILKIDAKKCMPSGIRIAKTKEDLEYIKKRCFSEPFGFDTETNFLNPFVRDPAPQLLCFSIAWLSDEDQGWCIPTNEKLIASGNCEYTVAEVMAIAEAIFFESEQPCFAHNLAYDLLVLYELFGGKQPKNIMADTMLLLNLYHYASKPVALKENTSLVGLPAYKDPIKQWIEENSHGSKKKGLGFEDVPLEIIGPYAALDAIAVVRLLNFLKLFLPVSLWKFYYNIPHKVLLTSNELAYEGYEVSADRYYYSKFKLEKEIAEAHKNALESVSEHLGADFNLASPKQLSELLFTKLNLPVFEKTPKGAPSTSQAALDDLILFHPFIFRLSKLRKVSKLYSTYVKGYGGVFGLGSRQTPAEHPFVINSQYKQTNRTARLAASNMTGNGSNKKTLKKKGGNILVLPAQGSLIKHYFVPKQVAKVENALLFDIINSLSDKEKEALTEKINFDITEKI